jgi:hypothetical protein
MTHDDPEGVTPSRLSRFGRDRQLEYMKAWFDRYYEDPSNETPIDEGAFVYIWGGPYDASDVLGDEFGDIVPQERIDELVRNLEQTAIEWAPTAEHPDQRDGRDHIEDDREPYEPDLDELVADLERGATPHFDEAEKANRAVVVARVADLEMVLQRRRARSLGIGHNRPPGPIQDPGPSADDVRQLTAAINGLKAQLAKPEPNMLESARETQKLKGLRQRWLEKFGDSTADASGKAVVGAVVASVVVAGAAVAGALSADAGVIGHAIVEAVAEVVRAVAHWIWDSIAPF